jgi:hypothetical protein
MGGSIAGASNSSTLRLALQWRLGKICEKFFLALVTRGHIIGYSYDMVIEVAMQTVNAIKLASLNPRLDIGRDQSKLGGAFFFLPSRSPLPSRSRVINSLRIIILSDQPLATHSTVRLF